MSSDGVQPRPVVLERIPSGVPGLDTILCGGFLRGGTYIVSGPPGAGKTILANQFCFHHVATGGRAIYVTLLAESHARMIALLRSMRFFDPAPITSSLKYVSAYKTLEEQGLDGLLDLLRREVRDHRATLLMIDGLVSAEAVAESELAFKKFIHELHTLVTLIHCTSFLLTNGSSRPVHPENTMVDGLVELSDHLVGLRAVRELVVRKFRGSAHLRGRHFFEISDEGVTIFPRSEALLTSPVAVPEAHEGPRLSFGVAALDEMLHGGLRPGSTTLSLGPAGGGKTVLGMHFVAAGARIGEPGLYFGFYESPPRVIAKGDGVGLEFGGFVERGLIEVIWQPPVDVLLDQLAQQVFAAVRRRGARRLFIDGLSGFKESSIYPERIGRFFAAFTNELRALGVTTVLADETRDLFGPAVDSPVSGLSAIVENMLFLRQVEIGSELRRVVSVLKTRDSDHDPALREFRITPTGIQVGGRFSQGAEGLMTGTVHVPAAKPKKPRARGKGRRG